MLVMLVPKTSPTSVVQNSSVIQSKLLAVGSYISLELHVFVQLLLMRWTLRVADTGVSHLSCSTVGYAVAGDYLFGFALLPHISDLRCYMQCLHMQCLHCLWILCAFLVSIIAYACVFYVVSVWFVFCRFSFSTLILLVGSVDLWKPSLI